MAGTDRLLAFLGLVCGVGALAVALHSRTSVPAVAPVAVASSQPTTAIEAVLATTTNEPMAWSVVAQRLRVDLRLNDEQSDELARVLAACEESVQTARQHPDALWRDRLIKRAHRDAYDLVIPMLTQAQREDFAVWLEAEANKEMAGWFQRGTGCKGCGGASDKSVAGGGSGGPALPGALNVR